MADNQVILNADIVFDQSKIQQRFAQLERNLKFRDPFGPMSRSVRTFDGELDRATTRVVTLGTAFTVLATASRTLRGIIESTVLVEKSLASVNSVFKLTTDNLARFSSGLFDISRETTIAFDKVAEAAQEFARQGLSVAETQKAVRAALLLSRDASLSVAESVRVTTAAVNSFNKEALSRMQVVNRLASADAAFAVSSKDLAEALVRTGSAASEAGVSFNEFIGLVTAAQQISQRGGSVIAGALNTIFTRINRRGTLEALDSLGVAITDVRGQALPTIQVLQNFAVAYDKMTGSIKNQAAELVGGVRQLNTLKATLKDLASEGSVFAQVQQVIARSTNEIERRNAARNQTLAAQGAQIGTTAQQIGSNIGNVGISPAIKSSLGLLLNNPITQALKEADGQAETAGGKAAESFLRGFGASVIYGLGPILLKVLFSITKQVGSNLLKDVQSITGLNSLEKQRLAIESDIVAVYRAGGTALQQQLSQMTSLAEKAALVRGLMSGTGTMVTPASAIAAQLQSTGFTRSRRVPGMAGGYVPYAEEMAAVNAGVGGAAPGSRAVLLNNFNFGGGKVGQIVANTSEYVVPHFAGGGSAIFNREMIQKMGLPAGARPIAAGGYIPHAAEGVDPSWSSSSYFRNLGFGGPPTGFPFGIPPGAATAQIFGGGASAGGQGFGQYQHVFPQVAPPPPPPLPPPLLSSSLSSGQLAKDFEMAQKEIVRATKEQARKAKERAKAMDEAFKVLEAENKISRRKSGFTKAETALQEKRLAEYQAEAAEARQVATKAFADQKAAAARAKAAVAPIPHPYEIRPVMLGGMSGYQAGTEGILTASTIPALVEATRDPRFAPNPYQTPFNRGITTPLAAPGMRERQAAARAMAAGAPAGGGASLWSRASAAASRPGTSIGLALLPSFLGGMIGEGKGGTMGGQAQTAASYGLQGMGMGSIVGSMLPIPGGTLAGAGIGAVIGALSGAIMKASKSFEELSLEVDQKNKKLNEELTTALDVFRINEELKDALSNGNVERVRELRQERAQQTGRVTNPKYRAILENRLNDPNAVADLAKMGNSQVLPNILSGDLLTAFQPSQYSRINPFAGRSFDSKQQQAAKQAVVAAISGMSVKELGALRKAASTDPERALIMVGHAAGMDGDQMHQLMSSSHNQDFIQEAIFRGASSVQLGMGVRAKQELNDTDNLAQQRQLVALSGAYRQKAAFMGVTGGANTQISQIQKQIALSNPALTDIGRLALQGTFGAQNIGTQAGIQRGEAIAGSQSKLLDLIGQGGGSAAFTQRVRGLKSAEDVTALSRDLSTTEGRNKSGLTSVLLGQENSAFRKELADLAVQLRLLDKTERENTRANNEGNRLMLEQLRFTKTYAGARAEYGGAAMNAGINLGSAFRRGDTPDRLLQDIVKTNSAGLQDEYNRRTRSTSLKYGSPLGMSYSTPEANWDKTSYSQYLFPLGTMSGMISPANPMSGREYSGRNFGIGANAAAVGTINNAEAVKYLLSHPNALGASDMTGSQASSGLFGGAQIAGRAGKAGESGILGFQSVFAGIKRDMLDFASVGQAVANSLNNSLGNAFGDFVTGAKQGKDAFRSFAVSVLGDASRMLGSKALSGMLSFIPGFSGFGSASGGAIGFAGGGMVPAMLTGGEYVVGPNAARRIGYDTLRRMNGMAEGGMVNGGSGVRDDVPARLAPGSFVIKKSATGRLGPDYLNALVGGRVQHRAFGGILSALFGSTLSGAASGALLGGGLGYLAGGKKGAIGGALLGGIGGGLYGSHASGLAASSSMGVSGLSGGATLSVGQKMALGLGAAGGLGLLAAGIGEDNSPGPLNDSQLPAYRRQLEAAQAATFGSRPNPYPILQVGPQGQNYLAGFTDGPATRRWGNGGPVNTDYTMPTMRSFAEGGGVNVSLTDGPATRRWSESGGVDVPLTVGSTQAKSGGGGAAVSVKIDIHNNGTTTSASSSQGGEGGAFQGDFANKLQKTVQGLVQQELVNQSRSDGFFSQRSRYT